MEEEKVLETSPKKKSNGGLIVIIVILLLTTLGLGGFIIYDKLISPEKETKKEEKENKETKEYKEYKIGDKVTIKLNDTEEGTFYVLKDSSKSEENVTLFAEKNIGTGAFNNNNDDGNEFKGSTIEKKLNELTASWTNVKEKRLITVEEIKNTGLTETKTESHCLSGNCPQDYTYVKRDTFLIYKKPEATNENDLSNYEFYWTMTKAESDGNVQYDKGKYVYYVDLLGLIDGHIVGYESGTEESKSGGQEYTYFGIRPVIEISKEYIK